MPDPVVQNPPSVVVDGTTMSPSPEPGQPSPQRRVEDTKSYVGEWTVLLLAVLGWATTFCVDAAQNETWQQITTPKFMLLHIAQLFSVTSAIFAAKRIR